MGKFKVGDRVRYRDNYCEGVGTIHSQNLDYDWFVKVDPKDAKHCPFDSNTTRIFDSANLEPAPKFAVGDRVRVLIDDTCGDYNKGDVVSVIEVDEEGVSFYDNDDDKRYLTFEYVAAADSSSNQPLTIREGRYYRTRDGRKVGPMERSHSEWYVRRDPHGRLWNNDGTRWSRNNDHDDLIAEWVDEPVAAGQKFKIGDKVRVISNSRDESSYLNKHIGKEFVVTSLEGTDGTKVAGDGLPYWWPASDLRLVASATSGKFKVGDKVRFITKEPTYGAHYDDGVLVIRELGGGDYDDDVELSYPAMVSWYTQTARLVDVELVAPSRHAIVALIENGQPKPATRPFVHPDRDSAAKEARRLAGQHKGKEFGVYELVDTAKEARVYEHEWQRLAVSGQKIAAIKEVRSATGFTLKGAKDAVERWLAVAAA